VQSSASAFHLRGSGITCSFVDFAARTGGLDKTSQQRP
jgi:hypothetical protein